MSGNASTSTASVSSVRCRFGVGSELAGVAPSLEAAGSAESGASKESPAMDDFLAVAASGRAEAIPGSFFAPLSFFALDL